MEYKEATILKIDSLENIHPSKGEMIDYVIVNDNLKEEFEKHWIRTAILIMLNPDGKILYY